MTTVAVSATGTAVVPPNPKPVNSPFFIFGCPRSGTSLLSAILGTHRRLAIPHESHFYSAIHPAIPRYGNLNHPPTLTRLVQEILRTEHIRMWSPPTSLQDTLAALTRTDFHGIVDAIMRAWASKQGKSRWGEKTPQHTLRWRTILPEFPRAQVIHLIRDGRDVVLSYKKAFFGPKHVYPLARRWTEYLAAAEQARDYLGEARFLQLRYEDLLADPEHELGRVCAFLGEEFDPGMLAYHQAHRTVHHERRNASNLRQPIISTNTGKWRTEMSVRELRIFESLAGSALERYGYSRALDRPRITQWEALSCQYLEHPARRAPALLGNSQARRLLVQRLRLHLCLMLERERH